LGESRRPGQLGIESKRKARLMGGSKNTLNQAPACQYKPTGS
jgi:hypothetical protein